MAKKKRPKRRPITIAEALKTVHLSDIRISPDGELAAFVRSVPRDDEKTRGASIWAAPSVGAKVRQLTQGPEDGQPRWSPDGQTLAFTRKPDKEESPQLFLLPRDGGEPSQLTKLKDMSPEAISFTPNGKRIAFLSPTPDAKKTKEGKEKGDDARVFVQDDKPKRLWTVSLKSGKEKAVSPEDLAIWEYDWIADTRSTAIIFTEEARLDALYFRAKLGVLDTKTAQLAPLDTPLRFISWLRVSPDGRHLAVIGTTGEAPFGGEAWVVDTDTAHAACLTPDLKGTVTSLEWLPDGSGLLLMVAEGMLTPLYVAKLDAPGKLQRVCSKLPAGIDGMEMAKDGNTVFAIGQDFKENIELWRAEISSDEAVKLTDLNARADKLRLGASRIMRYPSSDEFEIEAIVTLPPGFKKGKQYPTILLVHGGPCGRFRQEIGLIPRQLLANEGYVVIMPNPRGSSGYGGEFLTANFSDWGGGDFRDLMAGLDVLIEDGIADPDRLGIYGGSYGGYMTAWTVTQTDRFKAAVCQCGLTNLFSMHGQTDITPGFLELYFGGSPYDDPDQYHAHSAMTHIKSVQTPTLFLHGEQDVRVPIAQSYEMYWGMVHQEVDTEFVIYPREGHGIAELPHQRDLYRRVLDWFRKCLLDE